MSKQPRILVRSPNWIGDHVMALPFYRALKTSYPGAELTLLCPEPLLGLDTGGVFSRVIAIPSDERRFPKGASRLGRRLRGQFTLGISLPASWSAAWPLFLARIPVRVGFRADGNDLILTDSLAWKGRESGLHKSETYLDLLRWLTGHEISAPSPLVDAAPREKTILLAPGASIALREWPYFPELILALKKSYPDYRLLVVGGEREKTWHSRLARWGRGAEDWIEKTSLEDLRAMMKKAALVIANDSGLAHVAGTLAGAPTLVLLGPGDPAYILPRGPRVTGLRVPLPCSPCESAVCRAPYGYQRCLRELSVSHVLEAAGKTLNL